MKICTHCTQERQEHCKSDQGVKGMSLTNAKRIAGEFPDYHSADVWEAIERGEFPTWTFCVQIMTPEQYRWNIFDDTKVCRTGTSRSSLWESSL